MLLWLRAQTASNGRSTRDNKSQAKLSGERRLGIPLDDCRMQSAEINDGRSDHVEGLVLSDGVLVVGEPLESRLHGTLRALRQATFANESLADECEQLLETGIPVLIPVGLRFPK